MVCIFWQDECEIKVEEFMKKIQYLTYYEDDLEGM